VDRTHFVSIRMVVRILVMVPLYAVSSLISLFSLDAAFVIDAFRDIYEVCRPSFNFFWITTTLAGFCNLLLFPTSSRISRWGALPTHSGSWPPTKSHPLSLERVPTRDRR
jgi:hypothetical protein